MRKLKFTLIVIVLVISFTGCLRFRTEMYSDLKINVNYSRYRYPIERLLAEIWNSGFFVMNEDNKDEIFNNDYGTFKKTGKKAFFSRGRACFIKEKGYIDRILLNKNLFPHIEIVHNKGIIYKRIDKKIKATLIHELFHDFWYNTLDHQERYLFTKEAKKFYEEMMTATTIEDKLRFLEKAGIFEPTEDHLASYDILMILKMGYSDKKFFGTEMYSYLAEMAFSGEIIIPIQLRTFYKGIISERVLNKRSFVYDAIEKDSLLYDF